MLRFKRVNAVVFDKPVLKYLIKDSPKDQYMILEEPITTEKYGFSFPKDSPLRERVNIALLELIENGTFQRLQSRWF